MKPYSITRRVVTLVLTVELIAAICVTAFAFIYERHAHFRSFDVSLHGRADTVMGAVEDADDAKQGVMLDTTDLKFPRHDVYAVREQGAQDLGHSANWTPSSEDWQGDPGYFNLTIHGHDYRAIRLRGVRVVDPMAANVRHPLLVLYASPTHEVWEVVFGAVRVFTLANGLLVLVTALLVPVIVRRSMHPLHLLATDAEAISAASWHFAPGEQVRQVAELRPLVTAMEGVIQRLEHSFTQQRQFTGDAAHELKTAVAVVKSSIQLLELRARTPAEYAAGLQRSYADCLRMEELAQKMLLMARVDEPSLTTFASSTNLAATITAALAELAPVAELHSVHLLSDEIEPIYIQMELELLRSLLINLITNAIQHSPTDSTVRIAAERTHATAQITIKDTGEGIPPQALPHVFERFYRADASRSRKTGGTGLGLAICKAIVERASGNISITSTPAQGTQVHISLPIEAEPQT
ncbi:sensor histidine kinase [Granulicella arctica]|uniref:sensor histidine kinase n=1 Tax=Granulicella arctica TaxID=940613 RepID=UPI0021DFECC8|nr:HAMP domain-containing sensor histidine kinase [Granulicella arctica]